ncbi:MAG: hypothetical protein IJI38_06830 [Clostridia bacterium]|nr:hypothetical protein [Clostridia bacterium]
MKKAFCLIIIFIMAISMYSSSLADSDTSNRVSDLKIWMMQNAYLFPQEMDTAIAGIDAAVEEKKLVVIDDHKNEVLSVNLNDFIGSDYEFDGLAGCIEDTARGWFVLFSLNELSDEPMTGLYHLAPDGSCLWSSVFLQQVEWGWTLLAADGTGGVYFVHTRTDHYKDALIRHFSPDGKTTWKKTLSFDGLVFSPFAARSAGSNMTLYGTAVSKSNEIFRTVQIEFNMQGEIVATEARNFGHVTSDYASKIIWNRETQLPYLLYVSTSQHTKPLSELPLCDFPSLNLKDADDSDH